MHMDEQGPGRALTIFRQHGGLLRASEAIRLGIQPRTLYGLREAGTLVRVSRGVYRLNDLPPLAEPDLVTVSVRVPQAVLCLISALAFHDLTDEIPHEIYVALPRGGNKPKLDHPPLRVFRFSGPSLTEGIEHHQIDGCELKIFGPEKTVADCFKFRNRLGIDVAVEALRQCLERRGGDMRNLLRYARVCRVQEVMRPYLEALQ